MKKIEPGFNFWLIVISFSIAGLIIWGFIAIQGANEKKILGETSREVALHCTTDMATRFHIHPELKIIILGKEEMIPANIGIKSFCMNSIHTHNASGLLHVEAPIKKDFTLGDFFAVWGKDMGSFGTNMKMTVNGKENTEYENYIMQDNDKIELRYE